MPALFKEIGDECDMTETEDGVAGVRVFIRDDAAGTLTRAALPRPGESLMVDGDGFTVKACLCRARRSRFPGGIEHVYCQFNTRGSVLEYTGSAIPRDSRLRTHRGGVEVAPLQEGYAEGMQWETGSGTIEQPVGKLVSVQDFTVPVSDMSEGQARAFRARMQGYLGTINAGEFDGLREGSVMCQSYDGGGYFDEDGELRYAYEVVFAQRIINDELGTVTQDDWLYDVNQRTGAWGKVVQVGTAKPKYRKTDFAGIFA